MERRRIIKTEEGEDSTKVEELELPGAEVVPEPSVSEELKEEPNIVLPEIKGDAEDEEELMRFRKIGGGTFRMASGKIIKPNQVFTAKASEIPQGARKFVIALSGSFEEAETPKRADLKYSLRVRSPGWYDIVDGEGKVINETALREAQAREMLKSLAG